MRDPPGGRGAIQTLGRGSVLRGVKTRRTVSVHFLRSYFGALAARGVDVLAFARELGIAEGILGEPEGRVSAELYLEAWRRGPPKTGDEDFGLHAGESIPANAYELLDFVTQSAPNVGEAMRRGTRYFRVMSEAASIDLVVDGESASIVHRWIDDGREPPRHASECFFAILMARWARLTGHAWVLTRVAFMHPRPMDVTAHARLFRAPFVFDAEANRLTFKAALLETPLLSANPDLHAMLVRRADDMLAELPTSDSYVDRTRHAAARSLRAGELGVEAIAARLDTSARTLQRRLAEEGTSLRALLRDERRRLALRELETGSLSIEEVGFLAGFENLSAFCRAFRRWTGTTPSAYRSTHRRTGS